MMTCLRRLILVALVWLTAASTLLAGLPHFECLCPNGQRGSYCLGIVTNATGCCCGGSCCISGRTGCCTPTAGDDRGEPQQAPTCCGQQEGEDTPASEGESKGNCARQPPSPKPEPQGDPVHVQSPGCEKTLAHAEVLTFARADTSAPAPFDLCLPLVDRLSPALPPGAVYDPIDWVTYCIPPPTDLVIALQHFLI
jgi:hypothetical protein